MENPLEMVLPSAERDFGALFPPQQWETLVGHSGSLQGLKLCLWHLWSGFRGGLGTVGWLVGLNDHFPTIL